LKFRPVAFLIGRYRMGFRDVLVFSAVLLSWTTSGVRADPLAPVEAASHVGEVATVCGRVASTKYAPLSIGAPTFLDFGGVYPNAAFTALIFGGDRAKFGAPDEAFKGKEVCVRGEIRLFEGTPQVILTRPDQLRENPSPRAGL
jgi:hypothetical protein